MNALLLESFTDAWRNLGTFFRLFWPVIAVVLASYAISFLLAAAWFSSDAPADLRLTAIWLIGMVIVFIYCLFIVCQGAVGWHRRVLLNEAPGWISPIPRRRAFQYGLAAFLFALMFVIGQMLVGFLLMPLVTSWMLSTMQDLGQAIPTIDQLDAMWKIMLPMQIAMLILSVVVFTAVMWLARSWLLVFPHISIRSVQPAFGQIKDSLDIPTGLVAALLVVYFLPSLLGLAYSAITPFTVQILPWVALSSIIVQMLIGIFSFLWGLSVLSKAYAKAAGGKIPYEGGSAPA